MLTPIFPGLWIIPSASQSLPLKSRQVITSATNFIYFDSHLGIVREKKSNHPHTYFHCKHPAFCPDDEMSFWGVSAPARVYSSKITLNYQTKKCSIALLNISWLSTSTSCFFGISGAILCSESKTYSLTAFNFISNLINTFNTSKNTVITMFLLIIDSKYHWHYWYCSLFPTTQDVPLTFDHPWTWPPPVHSFCGINQRTSHHPTVNHICSLGLSLSSHLSRID